MIVPWTFIVKSLSSSGNPCRSTADPWRFSFTPRKSQTSKSDSLSVTESRVSPSARSPLWSGLQPPLLNERAPSGHIRWCCNLETNRVAVSLTSRNLSFLRFPWLHICNMMCHEDPCSTAPEDIAMMSSHTFRWKMLFFFKLSCLEMLFQLSDLTENCIPDHGLPDCPDTVCQRGQHCLFTLYTSALAAPLIGSHVRRADRELCHLVQQQQSCRWRGAEGFVPQALLSGWDWTLWS